MRLGRLKKGGKGAEGRAVTGWTTINDSDECMVEHNSGGETGGARGNSAAGGKEQGIGSVSMAASSTTAVNDMV